MIFLYAAGLALFALLLCAARLNAVKPTPRPNLHEKQS